MRARCQILHGDCLQVLRGMKAESVDAIITDPPAGIAFMGKAWDGDKGGRRQWIGWLTERMAEALRVLKPGGCAFVWALPRTSHWTGTALEDAGFEIRDVVTHIQSQGFPKSKALLKPASEHWILARKPGPLQELRIDDCRVPTDDSLARLNGPSATWGTFGSGPNAAARGKSAPGRWPSNLVLSHAEGCRQEGTKRIKAEIPHARIKEGTPNGFDQTRPSTRKDLHVKGYASPDGTEEVAAWICEPQCPVALLDQQSGVRKSGGGRKGRRIDGYWQGGPLHPVDTAYEASEGTASRFFHQFPYEDPAPFLYQPKASRRERNAGCEGLPARAIECGQGPTPQQTPRQTRTDGNHHPTVKPVALMRWLCRLITPPGGLVLDPFAGSGTTGVACAAEGLAFVGIEREAEYVTIARRRCGLPLRVVRQHPRRVA